MKLPGRNRVAMPQLREALEEFGFEGVSTYVGPQLGSYSEAVVERHPTRWTIVSDSVITFVDDDSGYRLGCTRTPPATS